MDSVPKTLTDAARGLRERRHTAVELLDACTERADALDDELGVYIARFDEEARRAAREADRELEAGVDRGVLHGIPVGIKDIVRTAEAVTTGNSMVVNETWERREDASVAARLRRAGAIITGKVSTMEFALGVPDESKPFAYPRNPWDSRRWSGGSSSGSGAGVAAGMFFGAVGSDTGGSIRIPASYCGVTGLKPTFGRVPKDGVIPLGNSLDVVGPLARSADDIAALMAVMSGHAEADACSATAPAPYSWLPEEPLPRGMRIGVDRSHLDGGHVHPELVEVFDRAIAVLEDAGAVVQEVRLPLYDEVTAATIITWNSEAYAYHKASLGEQWEAFGFSVRTALASGSVFTAADYIQAQKVRRLGSCRADELFTQVDAVVSPTVTSIAPEVDGLDSAKVYASVFTNYWSGLGNPAINVPIGFSGEGLPFGVQIAGRPFEEATLIGIAHRFQTRTDWHLREPALMNGATDA